MTWGLNKLTIIGKVGRNPEKRFTQSGKAVANFSVMVNRSWRTASGEQHEEQEWFTVVAWDRLADICYSLLKKDILVYIEGPVHTRSWKDDNGVTRSIIEVVADDMRVLCDHNLPVAQADDDESIDSYAF